MTNADLEDKIRERIGHLCSLILSSKSAFVSFRSLLLSLIKKVLWILSFQQVHSEFPTSCQNGLVFVGLR